MRNPPVRLIVLVLLSVLTACHSRPPKPDDALAWTQEPPQPPTNGAIYQAGREVVYAENPVAHHVGDIVTIVLNEQTAAQKSATTSTSKATSIAMPGPTLLGKAVTIKGNPVLQNSVDDATKFQGQGASAESNSLTGYLTATVLKVLPNGNLFIAGEKQIGLNQGKEYVRVTGVIRPIDLAADDSIPSFRVASAKITYNGKGALADANAQSWLSRFFNSPWAPF
ncbi:MAG TPA: flagellar basal body L-ring protein FlgH [Steroidobacteraceae bacterium]|nr:flagellar basal body L-ring protein FlgH [Steroidobacteraceae bacterium]